MNGKKLGGLITLLAGIGGGLFSAFTISDDMTPKGLFSQGYSYTAPFTSHEIFMILLAVASGIAIIAGIALLSTKNIED